MYRSELSSVCLKIFGIAQISTLKSWAVVLTTFSRGLHERLTRREYYYLKRKWFLPIFLVSLHERSWRVHPNSYQQLQLDIYWELCNGGQVFGDSGVDREEGFNIVWRLLKHTEMAATGVMLRSWMVSARTVAELPPHTRPNESSSVRLRCGESS